MVETIKTAKAIAHPSGDKRFKLLEVTMKRHQFQQHALIEVLHSAQELFGFLEIDLLFFIARHLKLPPSKVYGVATFYNFFTLRPKGEHTCVLCTGTACYVKGADALLEVVQELSGIRAGEVPRRLRNSACGGSGWNRQRQRNAGVAGLRSERMAIAWTRTNWLSWLNRNDERSRRCAYAVACPQGAYLLTRRPYLTV